MGIWRASLLALILPIAAAAQTQPFEPYEGQPGKDVVWVPTPRALVEKMLDLAAVTPRDLVVDLGSGDGRLVIAAAKRGARSLGIEYEPDMVELARKNAAAAGVADRATFVRGDMFEADFKQATVLTLFLLPGNPPALAQVHGARGRQPHRQQHLQDRRLGRERDRLRRQLLHHLVHGVPV